MTNPKIGIACMSLPPARPKPSTFEPSMRIGAVTLSWTKRDTDMMAFRTALTTLALFSATCSLAQGQSEVLNANTRFEGVFGGERVSYEARVERTDMMATDDLPAVSLVTTAYLADTDAASERPVIFLFNGGPGAPSSWLHMGGLGPVRINAPVDPAAPVPAEIELTANTDTLLGIWS